MKRKHSSHRQLSVRRVSFELAIRLDGLRKKRGTSLNQTVLDLLYEAVGLSQSNGWTDKYTRISATDAKSLERAVESMREVDPRDWS